MAEERKTFKWGDQEYLLDDLLKLHAQYENNYYDFARNRGQYNDEALVKLRDAVANRINNLKQGVSFEGDGVLSTDKADNITILTQKKGLFKKDKYVDQDNTEWAKYYLNKLVNLLKPHKKENPKEWKASEYSLEKFLQYKGVDPQEIFETLDLTDDPDAKRVTTERRKVLLPLLQEYETWLNNKDFEFNKNDTDWDDNHGLNLTTYIRTFNNLDDTELARVLREYGAGDAYATAFTSNKLKLGSSTEEDKAKREAREKEEADKIYQERMRWALDYALEGFTPWGYQYAPYTEYSEKQNPDGTSLYPTFSDYYSSISWEKKDENGIDPLVKYGTQIDINDPNKSNYLGTLFSEFIQKLKNFGKKHQPAGNERALLLLALERSSLGFTDLGDGITYLINDSVNEKGVGYTYNKITGALLQVHLHNLAELHPNIKTEYKKLLHRLINSLYGTDYKDTEYVFETGGIIKAQLGTAIFNPYNPNDYYKERAAKEGVNVKTQKAKDRYINEDNKSVLNPNAGLTGKDMARLSYAAADIGSTVLAFVPVYGTIGSAATGLYSTIGNFITDMTDDAVTAGDAWGNLGMNLGMDLLGLIPGGGAAAKGAKILKTIKYLVPTIIALPGVTNMLANSPEIAESFNKAFGSDESDKLTYQDYMNILLVINVVTGGTTIARNAYKSATRSKANPNKIAVEVTDKAGNRKALVFEGDDVDNFKAADNEGKAQEFIDKIEGGNNYKIVEETSFNKGKFWGRGTDDEFHLFHQSPLGFTSTGKAKIHEVRSQQATFKSGSNKRKPKKPVMEIYASTGLFGGGDIMGKNVINLSSKPKLDDFKAKLQKIVDTEIETLKTNAKVHADAKKQNDFEIGVVNSGLKRASNYKSKYDALETQNVKTIDNNTKLLDYLKLIATDRKTLKSKELDLQNLRAQAKRTGGPNATVKKQLATTTKEIALLKKEILVKQQNIDALKAEVNFTDVATAQKAIMIAQDSNNRLAVLRAKLQDLLNRLGTKKSTLSSRYTTNSADFDALLNNYPKKVKFNGVEYSFGPETAFTRQGLLDEDLYKQGGSINRNKINKFLNYGKR